MLYRNMYLILAIMCAVTGWAIVLYVPQSGPRQAIIGGLLAAVIALIFANRARRRKL